MARRGVQFILIKCARCNRADCLKRIKKVHYNLTLAPRGKRKPNVLRRGLDWAGQPDSSKPAPMSARDSVQSINYALRASGSTFPAASLEWNFGRTSRDRIRTDSSLCCCTAVVFIFVLLLLWSVACGRVWGWRVLRIKQTQPLVSIKRPRIVLVQMCSSEVMNWVRIFITVQLVKILRVFDEWVGDVRSCAGYEMKNVFPPTSAPQSMKGWKMKLGQIVMMMMSLFLFNRLISCFTSSWYNSTRW